MEPGHIEQPGAPVEAPLQQQVQAPLQQRQLEEELRNELTRTQEPEYRTTSLATYDAAGNLSQGIKIRQQIPSVDHKYVIKRASAAPGIALDYRNEKRYVKTADFGEVEVKSISQVATKQVSPQAILRRRRLMQNLGLSEQEKMDSLAQKDSLRVIAAKYASRQQVEEAAKNVESLAGAMNTWMENIRENVLLSPSEKIQRFYQLCIPFETDIVLYEKLYIGNLKEGQRRGKLADFYAKYKAVRDFIDNPPTEFDYDARIQTMRGAVPNLFNEDDLGTDVFDRAGMSESLLDKVQSGARLRNTLKPGSVEEGGADVFKYDPAQKFKAKELEGGLSDKTIANLNKADKLLVCNPAKWTKSIDIEVAAKLMSLSKRERLFFYYIIENKAYTKCTELDRMVSQIGYEPDLKKISSNIGKNEIEKAFQLLLQNREGILSYAQEIKNDGVGSDNDATEDAQGNNPYVTAYRIKVQERNEVFKRMLAATHEVEVANKELNSSRFRRTKYQQQLNEKTAALDAIIRDLIKKDTELKAQYLETDAHTLQVTQNNNPGGDPDPDANDIATQKNDIRMKGNNPVYDVPQPGKFKKFTNGAGKMIKWGLPLTGAGNAVMAYPWDLSPEASQKLSLYGKGVGLGISGTLSIANSLLQIVKLGTSWNATMYEEKLKTGTSILSGFASAANSGYGMYKIYGASDLLGKVKGCASQGIDLKVGLSAEELVKYNNITATTTALGAVTNAFSTGLTIWETGEVIFQDVQRKRAQVRLSQRWQDRAHQDENIQTNRQRYEQNMDKLSQSLHITKGVTLGMDWMARAAGWAGFVISTAGITAPFATFATGLISSGLAMTKSLTEYIAKKLNNWRRCKDFLDADMVFEKLGLTDAQKEKAKKHGVIKRIEKEMMAELGFTTYEEFFKHIIKQYAGYLHSRIFRTSTGDKIYDPGNNAQPDPAGFIKKSELDANEKQDIDAYRRMAESFGLHIRYPKTIEADGKPTVPMMIAKMSGA